MTSHFIAHHVDQAYLPIYLRFYNPDNSRNRNLWELDTEISLWPRNFKEPEDDSLTMCFYRTGLTHRPTSKGSIPWIHLMTLMTLVYSGYLLSSLCVIRKKYPHAVTHLQTTTYGTSETDKKNICKTESKTLRNVVFGKSKLRAKYCWSIKRTCSNHMMHFSNNFNWNRWSAG